MNLKFSHNKVVSTHQVFSRTFGDVRLAKLYVALLL